VTLNELHNDHFDHGVCLVTISATQINKPHLDHVLYGVNRTLGIKVILASYWGRILWATNSNRSNDADFDLMLNGHEKEKQRNIRFLLDV
jgi:hypothetical protein